MKRLIINNKHINATKNLRPHLLVLFRREIYKFLDEECGGYCDYDGKVESLMEEYGMTKEEANSWVWEYTTGVHN